MNFKTKVIGVDVDFYTESKATREIFLNCIRKKAAVYGRIVHERKTKRGHHFKIKLKKQVGFWRSIEIRYTLDDDEKRMFYDIMRYRSGAQMIDILYDIKRPYKKRGKKQK